MSDGTTVQALLRLAEVMDVTAADLQKLAERARARAEAIDGGQSWRESVTSEHRPLIVERLTEVLDALARHGAAFRKAEARVLHVEGLSQEHIATLFGVTRQRVGALLSDAPGGSRRRGDAAGSGSVAQSGRRRN
jgi:DNA-directed RNA polymerase specialized sigma24 family protein